MSVAVTAFALGDTRRHAAVHGCPFADRASAVTITPAWPVRAGGD
jgi:hypothetical protein